MIIDEKTIRAALLIGERITLEAKRAEKEIPKSVWETYSPFANTHGGLILLGIEEHQKEKNPAKRYEILGVEDAAKIRKDFWDTVNSNKVSQSILTDSDVEVVDVDGMNLGSGFPMIESAWKAAGWVESVLKNQIDLDEVELDLPVQTKADEAEKHPESTLKGTRKSIVEIMLSNPNVTIPQIAELLGMNSRGIDKHIKSLREQGLIRRVGPDKGGHWEVIKDSEL